MAAPATARQEKLPLPRSWPRWQGLPHSPGSGSLPFPRLAATVAFDPLGVELVGEALVPDGDLTAYGEIKSSARLLSSVTIWTGIGTEDGWAGKSTFLSLYLSIYPRELE